MEENFQHRRSTGPPTSKTTSTKKIPRLIPRPEVSSFRLSAPAIEGTFWVVLIAFCVIRGSFYWKAVLVSASLARISYLATIYGWQWLPAGCTTLPDAILWLLWLVIILICVVLCTYCLFLSPIHLYWSPMDLWTKYRHNPASLNAFDVLFDPGNSTRAD